jgi:hypothetical protein
MNPIIDNSTIIYTFFFLNYLLSPNAYCVVDYTKLHYSTVFN